MAEQKLYRTIEAAELAGIQSTDPKNRRYLYMECIKKLGFAPAEEKTREGKGGKPEKFWTAEQIDAIKEYYNAHRKNSSNVENNPTPKNEVDSVPNSPTTIEPVATNGETNNDDNPKLSSEEPTANKNDDNFIVSPISETITLDERANRIRKLQADVQRGIIQIGLELAAAKKEVGHGNWADWLAREFDWTQQTANRFMRVSERFGKLNNVVQFKPSTLQAMLALPEGEEQAFIEEQASNGNPIESQSAREVQASIKHWKQNRHKEKQDSIQAANNTPIPADDETEEPTDEVKGTYVNLTGKPANDVVADELNAQATKSPSPTEPTIDAQTPVVAATERNTGTTSRKKIPLDLEAIRELVFDKAKNSNSLQELYHALNIVIEIIASELQISS